MIHIFFLGISTYKFRPNLYFQLLFSNLATNFPINSFNFDKMLCNFPLTILSILLISLALSSPMISDYEENRTYSMRKSNPFVNRNNFGENAATCYDSRIASFINTGLSYYSHNMGQLANYILNQIKLARYAGYWLVHAEMIGGQQQGIQWQSAATGDIFAPSSRHGCYYHDSQTYIIVIQY